MQFSVVKYSDIDKKNFRLEAEYYNSNSTIKGNYFTGNDIISFVQYGTSKELNEDNIGYPALRLNEFDSYFIKHPSKYCNKINETTFNALKLKKGDVLICRTNGNPKFVGKSAIVPQDYNYVFASYLFRVRPDPNKILATVLVVYLNSVFGRAEIEKYLMVSNQANFSPAKFREILIPNLNNRIQHLVDKIVWQAHIYHKKSIETYNQAQSVLLSELRLDKWEPKHHKSFVKKFSDAEKAERLDAEYFQPKYEEIVKAIKKNSIDCATLGEIANVKKGIEVGSLNYVNEGVPFIRVSNVTPLEITEGKYVTKELYEEFIDYKPRKGELLLTKDASPGVAYYIKEEPKAMIISSGVLRLIIKDKRINNEYLALALNSLIVKEQMKRDVGGSVILHWRIDQIKDVVVPILREIMQKQIKDKVTTSFELRNMSNSLLEIAKKGVELAIVEGEQASESWLRSETDKYKLLPTP